MRIDRLPPDLENVDELIRRRTKAAATKELWRSVHVECYQYAMPARETFTWNTPGQNKNRLLYDSTLQESTYTAANTTVALLFPGWTRWAELSPGGAIPEDDVPPAVVAGLQKATKTFFDFLNSSNFGTVIGEVALDLMIGTGGLTFDEGDNEQPFLFSSIPLSAIEIEEGPNGTVETTFMLRKPRARHITRLYDGLELFDLPTELEQLVEKSPDTEVELIQCEVYHPQTKKYFGIVVHLVSKQIIWRYDYGTSCPSIIARATKVAGETYGRGRVMLALSDARTLDRMQEFVLKQAALQLAPPMTGVSDGVLNPYTAVIAPNVILPVASNDSGNPSLRVLEVGGNFQISEAIITSMRERVRRTMLGPEPSEGAVKSASEINISDRNRLWSMNGEFGRIQSELLAKIVSRGVFILQRKGLIPKFKINGREVTVKYNSPFSKSQSNEDVMALERVLASSAALGPQVLMMGLKGEEIPGWFARKSGVDEALIRSPDERKDLMQKGLQAAQQLNQQMTPPDQQQPMAKAA